MDNLEKAKQIWIRIRDASEMKEADLEIESSALMLALDELTEDERFMWGTWAIQQLANTLETTRAERLFFEELLKRAERGQP
jgi:hypothetical protein